MERGTTVIIQFYFLFFVFHTRERMTINNAPKNDQTNMKRERETERERASGRGGNERSGGVLHMRRVTKTDPHAFE